MTQLLHQPRPRPRGEVRPAEPAARHRFAPRARRPVVVAAVVAVLTVIGAAGAWAYVRATGTGTGVARTAATVQGVTIFGPSAVAVGPGQSVTLSGRIKNPNAFPVSVPSVAVTISGVDSNSDTPGAGVCPEGTFVVTSAPGPFVVPATSVTGRWSGATLTWVDLPGVNQDACLDSIVLLSFAVGS